MNHPNWAIRDKLLERIKEGEKEFRKNGNLEKLRQARIELAEWYRGSNENNGELK